MRFGLGLACHVCCSIFATAQTADSLRSVYIKSYSDKFFLWPVLKQRELSFEMQHLQQPGNAVKFKPNNSVGVGLGMYLFDLGLELVFAVPTNEDKAAQFGKTKAQDIQLNILSRKWGGDIFYQHYQGFYLANPDSPVPSNSPYPQRPDIESQNMGVSGVYIFNHSKFSLRSAYTFADRQLKSRGSFLLSGTLNSFRLSADSVVLNTHYSTRIALQDPFTSIQSLTFGVAPGYGHNFIWKKMFLSASLSVGPALHSIAYEDEVGNKYFNSKINTFADFRLALGYSSDHFFTGLTFTTQTRTARVDNIQFGTSTGTYRFLFGWRFKEFGILTKSVWGLLPPWGKKG